VPDGCRTPGPCARSGCSGIAVLAANLAKAVASAMRRAYAAIPERAIAPLEPVMTNDPGDGHLLAAAVASDDAHAIVTSNVRLSRATAYEPFGIESWITRCSSSARSRSMSTP